MDTVADDTVSRSEEGYDVDSYYEIQDDSEDEVEDEPEDKINFEDDLE